ncbi:hypothetical protein ABF236_003446 [Yersinia ruckeri]|nr:hypothetical protein [Yersinia ruckeri]
MFGLLGSMASFPIGKVLKIGSVSAVVAVLFVGGYVAHSKYNELLESISALGKTNKQLALDNAALEQSVTLKDGNISLLQADIDKRDNRLKAQEETQKVLDTKITQQQEESRNAVEQIKQMLASSQCANERMPDDVIRLQRQRTANFNKAYGG